MSGAAHGSVNQTPWRYPTFQYVENDLQVSGIRAVQIGVGWLEYILNSALKQVRQPEGQGNAGIVTFRLDGVDRLPGNAQPICDFSLRPVAFRPQHS